MLAPEHPSPWQSSQVYVLLLALQGSTSFFSRKKNIQKHQKSRSHVTRVRIVRLRTNDCPSEPPARKEGIFLCLKRFTVEAETLQTHAQRYTPRSNPIVGAMPLSCFSSVQEHSLLWTSRAPARTGPSHPTTSRPPQPQERPSARPFPDNSGKVRSVLWRAAVTANSPRDAAPLLAVPSLPRGQTRVVTIANYAPPKSDNPSAETSRRPASLTLNQVTSKSQTVTFVETRSPASLCGGALQRVAPSPKHPNRRTQLDDGQGRRRDDHIGKCDWTRGSEDASGDKARDETAAHRSDTHCPWRRL